MITFHYATDEEGHLVNINDVTKDNRANHYYCIACGEEMSAVLGNKREHHFRHKEKHCSWETYLHKLGKKKLKERFESKRDFIIKYYVAYFCNQSTGCKLQQLYNASSKCNRRELKESNLNNIYDTCEEEVTYKGYRADLLLKNSKNPDIEPIFLEISVTHDCEPEKLASGIKIIELKISAENDVLRPLVEEDSLSNTSSPIKPYEFNSLPPIRFYNFERRLETKRPLERFWVSRDEKGILRGNCIQDDLNCQNVLYDHKEDSIYEIAIPTGVEINYKKPNFFAYGMIKAITAGVNLKHCGLCNIYYRCVLDCQVEIIKDKTGEKLYESRRLPVKCIQNLDKIAQANVCQNYSCDLNFVRQLLYAYSNLPFWEWKRAE